MKWRVLLAIVLSGTVVACAPVGDEPRTAGDFRDDGLARDGVLARCSAEAAAVTDAECSAARRAAAIAALEAERASAARSDAGEQVVALYDVYASPAPLGLSSVEVAPAAPPSNELEILAPELPNTAIAVMPRLALGTDANASN